MSLLDVQDLSVNFVAQRDLFGRATSHIQAVSRVSLQVPAGKTLGIVGESGCGKSTLGKALLKLIPVTSGRVLFEGADVTLARGASLSYLRRNMQMVFQDPFSSLNPRFKVAEILQEPLRIHNTPSTQAERLQLVTHLLDEVGLPQSALDRFPHEFSGGQRQRIGIARALALSPKLIIADEPVSALDVSVQSQILNLMYDLQQKRQLSYIFIAHDLAVVEHISDFVAVMYLGRIVEYASVRRLFTQPRHPYTQGLLKAVPEPVVSQRKSLLHKDLVGGDIPNPANPPSGCHFHPRCPLATDLCRAQAPQLAPKDPTEPSHTVACHYA